MVELRVDRIGDVDAVERLLRQPHDVSYILTIRTVDEGGAWDGDEAQRIALFERLGLLLPGFIDLEFAAWQRSANLRQKIGLVADVAGHTPNPITDWPMRRAKNALILSHHDLAGTPSDTDMMRLVERMLATPAAAIKVVFNPSDAWDALRILMLQVLARGRKPLIAMGIGEAGLITRVLARRQGMFAAYAALERGGEAAAGQPTIADLRSTYRWDAISPTSRVYGVIGWPVSQSKGPALHNAALSADAIDAVYLPIPVRPTYEAFETFIWMGAMRPWTGLSGFSVTIPHKEHALRWLRENGGEITPLAERCGAVNTLVRRDDGSWLGDNTDVHGVWHALDSLRRDVSDSASEGGPPPAFVPGNRPQTFARVAVLGAGGVARAVVIALQQRGCQVTLFNRTPERAEALARELGCDWAAWDRRSEADVDLLVNCTSVGMSPAVEQSPLPPEALRPGMTVFDTVYSPAHTRLLRDASAAGCRTISGEWLFAGQAAEQYRRWHQRTVPASVDWPGLRLPSS